MCSERGRVGDGPSAGRLLILCAHLHWSVTPPMEKQNTEKHITSLQEFHQVSHIPLQLITCYLKQCLACTSMSGEVSRADQPDLRVLEQQAGDGQRSG